MKINIKTTNILKTKGNSYHCNVHRGVSVTDSLLEWSVKFSDLVGDAKWLFTELHIM